MRTVLCIGHTSGAAGAREEGAKFPTPSHWGGAEDKQTVLIMVIHMAITNEYGFSAAPFSQVNILRYVP